MPPNYGISAEMIKARPLRMLNPVVTPRLYEACVHVACSQTDKQVHNILPRHHGNEL